jgi:hypothetical protein
MARGNLGAGNCSRAGPVLLHEFANPAPGSLPARWRGLTLCRTALDQRFAGTRQLLNLRQMYPGSRFLGMVRLAISKLASAPPLGGSSRSEAGTNPLMGAPGPTP